MINMYNEEFVLTKEHLKLVKCLNVTSYEGEGFFRTISIDYKRPYGNSDITSDIFRILKWKIPKKESALMELEEKAIKIHNELLFFFEIFLQSPFKKISLGKYKKNRHTFVWKKSKK